MDYAIIILIFAAFGFVFGMLIYFADNKLGRNKNKTTKDTNPFKRR
jgi:NADH:ubiquinone oxidoreductase subunit 3 (subunit A)